MKQKTYTLITMGAVSALMIAMICIALTWPKAGASQGYGPAIYPIIVMSVVLICALIISVQTVKKEDPAALVNIHWDSLKPCLRLFASIAIYGILLKSLGFILCTLLFLIINMYLNGVRLRTNIIISVVLTVVLYVLFKVVLKVALPSGILG